MCSSMFQASDVNDGKIVEYYDEIISAPKKNGLSLYDCRIKMQAMHGHDRT